MSPAGNISEIKPEAVPALMGARLTFPDQSAIGRQFLAANGRLIRKINQAFFAFHGSYASSPASVSPINEQLKVLRRRSDSLEDFLKLVASFGSIQEFLDYLG